MEVYYAPLAFHKNLVAVADKRLQPGCLCLRMHSSCYTLFLSPYTGLECQSDPSYIIAIISITMILIIAIILKVIMTEMKIIVEN